MTGDWQLINPSDVVKMFIPFPNIESGLAYKKHMYVVENDRFSVFAIQTAKPQLVERAVLNNYLVLNPGDMSPVVRQSYLGMDTRFILEGVEISDSVKASIGLSEYLFDIVKSKARFVTDNVVLNQREVAQLNEGVILL